MSDEALQTAVKRREAKSKGEKERYAHLNAEFQRIARRDKKAFFSDQCKEIKENNRRERLEISSRKLEIPREHYAYPYHSLASSQTAGREHRPTHQQKIGLKIYCVWPHKSSKTQFIPQPVPPIRNLPQASYPNPSEGRQKKTTITADYVHLHTFWTLCNKQILSLQKWCPTHTQPTPW